MRCFIAIDIPDTLRENLANSLEILHKRLSSAKWVAPQNYHISLSFLGEINDESLNRLRKIIQTAVGGISHFTINIKGTGVFGKIESPRVLWAGVEYCEPLLLLQSNLTVLLNENSFPVEDRKYSPHLTLARFSRPERSQYLGEWLDKFKYYNFGKVEVKAILLMQSILQSRGPIYHMVESFDLQDTIMLQCPPLHREKSEAQDNP